MVLGALFILLKYSKWGLGVRVTASNEFTAELMGVDTRKITAVSWALAGALGVLAAVMYAGGGTTISASFMTTIQVNAFLAGIGRLLHLLRAGHRRDTHSGGLELRGLRPNYQAFSGISRWQMVVVYVLMLLAILLKPEGLFGKKTVKKV